MTIWMQMTALKAIEALARRDADAKTAEAREAYDSEGATSRFAKLSSEARKARALVTTYFN